MNAHLSLASLAVVLAAPLAGCVTTPQRPLEAGSQYSTGALSPDAITVLSWNIEKGRAKNWTKALDDGQIDARLRGVDLLILQEACVKHPDQLIGLGQMLARRGYGWRFATSFVSTVEACDNGQANGVLIASRASPLQTLAMRSKTREFGLAAKSSLAMLFALAGSRETLLVINTHMLTYQFFSIDGYAAQLAKLAELVGQHQGPVLFVGDLNTHNQARLDLVNRMMRQHCLKTEAPKPPDTRTKDSSHHTFVLDYILFRGLSPVKPLSVGSQQGQKISDHNSIAATFRLGAQKRVAGLTPPTAVTTCQPAAASVAGR